MPTLAQPRSLYKEIVNVAALPQTDSDLPRQAKTLVLDLMRLGIVHTLKTQVPGEPVFLRLSILTPPPSYNNVIE